MRNWWGILGNTVVFIFSAVAGKFSPFLFCPVRKKFTVTSKWKLLLELLTEIRGLKECVLLTQWAEGPFQKLDPVKEGAQCKNRDSKETSKVLGDY